MDKNSSDQIARQKAVDAVLQKMRDKVFEVNSPGHQQETSSASEGQVVDKKGNVVGTVAPEGSDAAAF